MTRCKLRRTRLRGRQLRGISGKLCFEATLVASSVEEPSEVLCRNYGPNDFQIYWSWSYSQREPRYPWNDTHWFGRQIRQKYHLNHRTMRRCGRYTNPSAKFLHGIWTGVCRHPKSPDHHIVLAKFSKTPDYDARVKSPGLSLPYIKLIEVGFLCLLINRTLREIHHVPFSPSLFVLLLNLESIIKLTNLQQL